ncbi:oligopeptide ABC transporter ATP-binding protein [Escherichia coli]|nr:oligopeptide ABC transporter ATP-binding protein [Escherichia coli]
MSAVPIPDPDLEKNKTIQLLEGELPSPINPPSGCVFRTRCPIAGPECAKTRSCSGGEFQTRRFLPESRSALKTIRADSCQPFFTLKAIIYSRQMIWQSL